METQTNAFVTYGLEEKHCSAYCGSEKYYYIFDKSDGHKVKEIISKKRLNDFFEKYPEFGKKENFWTYGPDQGYGITDFGLSSNHLTLVIQAYNCYVPGCYVSDFFQIDIPYEKILPYLSSEAQKLIQSSGYKQ